MISLLKLKVRLHVTICQLRFVFWRMRNTADATFRHRYHRVSSTELYYITGGSALIIFQAHK